MTTLRNLITSHLSNEEVQAVETIIQQLEEALSSKFCNLSSEERRRYGSISEQNKLLVNKVHDYAVTQNQLCSPDVDWNEFKLDFQSRAFLERISNRIENILVGLNNAKTLHDYDNYQAALDDYAYTKYKYHTSASNYETKYNDLKQFFSRTKSNTDTKEQEETSTPKD